MTSKMNYLLGQGESYADHAEVKRGHGDKKQPYKFSQAKQRMLPRVEVAANAAKSLPNDACPNGEAVAVITIHPEFVAKSSYPERLINEAGFRAIGSKPVVRTPERISGDGTPRPSAAVDLFVAGSKKAFARLPKFIASMKGGSDSANDLRKLEDLRIQSSTDRIAVPETGVEQGTLMEVVLHTGGALQFILASFKKFLKRLKIEVDLNDRIDAGDLSFLAISLPQSKLAQVAEFTFMRRVRVMPRLRQLRPSGKWPPPKHSPFPVTVQPANVLDPTIRVAVFDGGMPDVPSLRRWVDRYDEDVSEELREYERHGLAVTSAVLFGPLKKGVPPRTPYARVDHYRVLDEDTSYSPQHELYPVLRRILTAIEREHYDFINLSIGPDLPIDDDDVHPWTAKLDPILAKGRTYATIAAGNTGNNDAATRLNRIQPPSDAVNATAVGACDSMAREWKRAHYSSVGYGRCPGLIKPDFLAFGGVENEPFWTLDYDDFEQSAAYWGTSFAAPYALHTAIGVRAILGPMISPLAIKALLIHRCKRTRRHRPEEVGWGRIETDIGALLTSPPGVAHVIYQGELEPRKYLRAQVPVPAREIPGPVSISATICFATPTDPSHPTHYTRSGLELFFRPDKNTIPEGKKNPKSKRFFPTTPGALEVTLRQDFHKWETVRNQKRRLSAEILKSPAFDIHYNPREEGKDAKDPKPIPYAMVISVTAPKCPDIQDHILARYQKLRPLEPRIQLTIRRGRGG